MSFLPVLLLSLSASVAPAAPAAPIAFEYTNERILAAPAGGDAGKAGEAWFARCAAGGEFAFLAAGFAPDPRIARAEREDAQRRFDRAAFERIAKRTYERVVAELPQRPLSLCVDFTARDDAFARDRMGGVMAMTAGSGKLIVKIHPDAPWQRLLPYVLAHELHHSYWAQHHLDPNQPFTLGDYLVFEGRADNYAMHAFGEHPAPWIDALDPAQYQATLQRFAPLYGEATPELLTASMFGDPKTGVPPWAGYTVGYRFVAKKIADEKLDDWRTISALPAAAFLPPTAPAPASGTK